MCHSCLPGFLVPTPSSILLHILCFLRTQEKHRSVLLGTNLCKSCSRAPPSSPHTHRAFFYLSTDLWIYTILGGPNYGLLVTKTSVGGHKLERDKNEQFHAKLVTVLSKASSLPCNPHHCGGSVTRESICNPAKNKQK